jgi:Regulator of chromosome condensation (RCC1) repeat/PASTA domain
MREQATVRKASRELGEPACYPSREGGESFVEGPMTQEERCLSLGGGMEREIKLSTGPRPPFRVFALVLLSVGLLFPVGGAQAAVAVRPVAWGCERIVPDEGWCNVPGGLSGATAIAAGSSHSLALKSDGTVVAWGCAVGDHGQCSVPAGLSGVTAIAAAGYHSLALKSDGTVVAWGCGFPADSGQCSVPVGLSGVTAIAAASYHSLALKGDGTVVAWGCGPIQNVGQCAVPVGLSGVTAIAAGFGSSLALKGDGTVVAWGCLFGNYGQCTPPVGLSGVTAIAAASYHSLALKSDGTVVAWGCGPGSLDFGQCSIPAGLSDVTAIAAGQSHNLALKGDGTVVAWGCGAADLGQCSVPIVLCHATAIAASSVQSLALAQLCQTIAFAPLVNRTYGGPNFSVSATASSGLPVTFAASGKCELSGAILHITGAGSCTVTASQAGNADYNPAPDVSQSFAITKAVQSITFGPLANKTYGAPDFPLHATASSGLSVSFAANGNCTVSGAMVHLTGAGSCTVTASQSGDANYNAAPGVSRSFSIARASCRVPKVVGTRVASAKRTIARSHCRTGKVSYAYSRKRMKGIVISQSRRPGKVLPARSKINLIVSRGRRR